MPLISLNSPDCPDVLTVDEVTAFLRIGRNTAYEAIRTGLLPCVRVGRRILIPKSALVRLIDVESGQSHTPGTARGNEVMGK